jgi:hypothetical protein
MPKGEANCKLCRINPVGDGGCGVVVEKERSVEAGVCVRGCKSLRDNRSLIKSLSQEISIT